MQIIIGILLIVLGIVILRFSFNIFNFTGRIDFVESWWPGGSSSAIKLFAIIMIIIGALLATGLGSWLTKPFTDVAGQLFGGIRQ